MVNKIDYTTTARAKKMAKWPSANSVVIIMLVLGMAHEARSFLDPISIVGRVKWNYTHYEENLWVREYTNRSLEQIFTAHEAYFQKNFGETDLLTSKAVPLRHRLVDALLNVKETWRRQGLLLQQHRYDEIRATADEIVINITLSMSAILSPTNQEQYFEYFMQVNRHPRMLLMSLVLCTAAIRQWTNLHLLIVAYF